MTAGSQDFLVLNESELSFFRMTCDVFANLESPLRYLEQGDDELTDAEGVFSALAGRGLLDERKAGAAAAVLERVQPVSECAARVVYRRVGSGSFSRNFYVSQDIGVEHEQEGAEHRFSQPYDARALAQEIAAQLPLEQSEDGEPITMSAGDYLVFAVFARDVREAQAEVDEAPMSLDEVLACFDEPETNYVPTPSDDAWQRSVDALCEQGVLVREEQGCVLHPKLHRLARGITAEEEYSVVRFDYLDEQWLVRELELYPVQGAVYRLGTERDGTVAIQALGRDSLVEAVWGVVRTLPNALSPDVPGTLRAATARASGRI